MRGNEQLTGVVVDTAYRLHTHFGPGLLESVYESVFARMLEKRGLHVVRQHPISFEFEGMKFDEAHRVDLLVENQVVVELKAVEMLLPVHSRQVLTYLRLMNLPVGLLINFGAAKLNDGLRRIYNPYVDSPIGSVSASPDDHSAFEDREQFSVSSVSSV